MLLPKDQKKNEKRRKIRRIVSVFLCLLVFSSTLLLANPEPARANMPVTDIGNTLASTGKLIWDKITNVLKYLWQKGASIALQTAVRNTLNTIAYDTATWAGSGGKGQKPQWLTGDVGSTMKNVADNAAGTFIESIGSQIGVANGSCVCSDGSIASQASTDDCAFYGDAKVKCSWQNGEALNLCSLGLDAKLSIGLGLVAQERPPKPNCTASDMVKNWSKTIQSTTDKEKFLKNFSNYFDIQQNDLGAALTMQTSLLDSKTTAKANEATTYAANGVWRDARNIAGKITGLPNAAKTQLDTAMTAQNNNIGKFTGDTLIDALNVFLNQLAVTAFQTGMKSLTDALNKPKNDSADNPLANPNSSPTSGGVAAIQGALRKVIEPQFGSTGDFDILNQLTMCSTGIFGVSPTECVLDQNLRQAISNQETVAEALKDGSLNGGAPFGFIMGGDNRPIEPVWNQGYPYRSLIILRKYRIIPVGWELAAQYIQTHPDEVARHNNLTDLVACYDPGDSYTGYNDDGSQKWCKGLVDPTWVLKAPQNYCAKQGYGPQILNSQSVEQGTDEENNKLPIKLMVNRADTYCGDEQSCIKENKDGSCKYFGYCTEDRRLWKFGQEACEPQYNTCQAFTSEAGDEVSYLKNSLEYCDQSQKGCEKYAQASSDGYIALTGAMDWTKNSGFIYLNKDAGECDAENEGCRGFIRTAPDLGTNLITNSNFERDAIGTAPAGWLTGNNAIVVNAASFGGKGNALKIEGVSDVVSYDRSNVSNPSVMPAGFVLEPEVSYTLSADVYIPNDNTGREAVIAIGRANNYWGKATTRITGSWQRLSVTVLNNTSILADAISFFGGVGIIYVDNVKFEVGNSGTKNNPPVPAYTAYGENNLIYEKFMPAYLQKACFTDPGNNNFSLLANAPSACAKFAAPCSHDDAGCTLFTKERDKSSLPAAVTDKDYCGTECVGYNTFIQAKDNFTSGRLSYFIPSTAQSCSAAAVGCEEFTSLASSTSGGEQKEYYAYLRQCVKPSEATCNDYYSWEGNAAQGQQLVKYSLEQGNDGPYTATDDCADIFNLPPTDPNYNPDCRQFYDKQGNITYHLYSQTVTCSDDCHGYRLTRKNVVPGIAQGSCNPAGVQYLLGSVPGNSLGWDNVNANCVYCKSGGIWNSNQNNCIYQAYIPESASCSAADNGCSEYNGNSGANSRVVSFADFENNNAGGWTNGTIVSESAVAGSMSYEFSSNPNGGGMYNVVGTSTIGGASYNLTFLAKAISSDVVVTAFLSSNTFGSSQFGFVTIKDTGWRQYSINLPRLNHATAADERLLIGGMSPSTNVYIDNIKLTQITDRYYLNEDSWNTPDSCNQDVNGNPYPLYMLGCDKYSDQLGNTHYLHDFDRVCNRSAVGCEAIIDTFNSNSPAAVAASGNIPAVPADRVVYAVYEQSKLCGAVDKGCERLGLAAEYAGDAVYKDAYLKNDPERYNSTICDQSGVGCNLFTSKDGQAYFKDPRNMVCEWRQASGVGANSGWGWWKKRVKRCGTGGNVCSTNKDCAASATCQTEIADTPCPTEKLKTVGFGGLGNEVLQPGNDGVYRWAGVCPTEQSTCAEYIDPVSDFSGNVVFNSDFSQNIGCVAGNDCFADGWVNTRLSAGSQKLNLEGNNLYVFTTRSKAGNFVVTIKDVPAAISLYVLGANNEFSAAVNNTISLPANESLLFYVDKDVKGATLEASDISSLSTNENKIIIRKAITDYQLADSVDKTTCNGAPDSASGCVLFNERTVNTSSGGLKALDPQMDPWAGYNIFGIKDGSGVSSFANALLKVKPDRTCNQWLACKSYIKDEKNKNVCFDIANCNRLDDAGNCANFKVDSRNPLNRAYGTSTITGLSLPETPDTIKNLTGYTKVGWYQGTLPADLKNLPNDLLNFGAMEQDGRTVIIPNGDFETYISATGDKGLTWLSNPSGWTASGGAWWSGTSTADSLYYVVADPRLAQNLGVPYPMIGKAFLRYSANPPKTGIIQNFPISRVVYLQNGQEYYLSYYINTSGLRGPADAKAEVRLNFGSGNPVVFQTDVSTGGWMLKTVKFIAASNRMNIVLAATAGSAGDVYVDDIQITSVLKAKSLDNDNYLADRQTCRIYPKEDSLSCEYTDDNGMVQKGLLGYCLEYDRSPGDPNACVLWWPIDKVQGSGLQVGQSSAKGYAGRSPLYYCVGATSRPYIDATQLNFHVDERFTIQVNGVNILRTAEIGYTDGETIGTASRDDHGFVFDGHSYEDADTAGSIADNLIDTAYSSVSPARIWLDFGKNIINVKLTADEATGQTHFSLSPADVYFDGQIIGQMDFMAAYNQTAGGTNFDGLGGRTSELMNPDHYCLMKCGSNFGQMLGPNTGECDNPDGEMADYNTSCGHEAPLSYTLNLSAPYCNKLTEVVDSYGSNKAWIERVRQGSDFAGLTCNQNMPAGYTLTGDSKETPVTVSPAPGGICSSTAIFPLFGSANPPAGAPNIQADPAFWTSPLFYQSLTSSEDEVNGQMGQLQSPSLLPYLFAETYGVWNWDSTQKHYVMSTNESDYWHGPSNQCGATSGTLNVRPAGNGSNTNCAVAPTITNMKLNNLVGATIFGRGFVNFTFNSKIDPQQAPLASYEIDWGDGESMAVTGAAMATRPNPDDPHSVYHSYDYYDLLAKFTKSVLESSNNVPTLICRNSNADGSGKNFCKVKPRVKLTDNWGWCTEGYTGNSCPAGVGSFCKNPSTGATRAEECYGNYVRDALDRISPSRHCINDSAFSICLDGWWESSGEIIVYEPGT